MRGHDGVNTVRDGGFKGNELDRFEPRAIAFQARQTKVGVDRRIAVTREVLGCDQHAMVWIGVCAIDVGGDIFGYILRILPI